MATNSKEVQDRADMKRKNTRSRNWKGILYPESAPDNWEELIEESCMDVLVSPLHDKDTNRNGELLKPHRHVLLLGSAIMSRATAADIMEAWGVVVQRQSPKPGIQDNFKVTNKVTEARYLCHLDSRTKYQYSPDDVLAFGNIDYNRLIRRKSSFTDEENALLHWIDSEMKKYDMTSYLQVYDWAEEHGSMVLDLVRGKFKSHIKDYCKAINYHINSGTSYDYN